MLICKCIGVRWAHRFLAVQGLLTAGTLATQRVEGINGLLAEALHMEATLTRSFRAVNHLDRIHRAEHVRMRVRADVVRSPEPFGPALQGCIQSSSLWPYPKKKQLDELVASESYHTVPIEGYPRPTGEGELSGGAMVWVAAVWRSGTTRASLDQLLSLDIDGAVGGLQVEDQMHHDNSDNPIPGQDWGGRLVTMHGHFIGGGLTVFIESVECTCCYPVTRGILCAHILAAMKKFNVVGYSGAVYSPFWLVGEVGPFDQASEEAKAVVARLALPATEVSWLVGRLAGFFARLGFA